MAKRARPRDESSATKTSPCLAHDRLTRLLHRALDGRSVEAAEAFAAVYDALRAQARTAMLELEKNHTLQPTDLAHAAFLKLVRQRRDWQGSERFLATAIHAMRSILVDHAKSKSRQKRSATGRKLKLDSLLDSAEDRAVDILEVDDALVRLAVRHARAARVVELRFFGGLSFEEISALIVVPLRTVQRDWEFAKAWLHANLR